MASEQDAYNELSAYTMTRGYESFIHQHVVDAWAAQHADHGSKPITVAFSLAGLYLHVEQAFSGRQVQQAHIQLARTKRVWPTFVLPEDRGTVTALDVMAAPAGAARDTAIDTWCASVWNAFSQNRAAVLALLQEHRVL